ncbi:MAG: hypothetical protein JXB07_00865 [Anaerolineae bacterium]|nr:hypothetical protein [Anaerolineae bacterium]
MRRVYLLATIGVCILLFGLTSPSSRSKAADSAWTGQYYKNRYLSGTPAATRQDSVITFKFGDGPPMEGFPSDDFSIRWTRRDYFEARPYMFGVCSDDGSRMYVDGVLIIDNWRNQEYGEWAVAERKMTAGEHTVVVEYYEATGTARIQAGHEPKYTPTPKNPTKTPTKGPSPTPTLTFTPRPTKTPSIIGTVGVKPTAFRPPPTMMLTTAPEVGEVIDTTVTPSLNQMIFELDPKLFVWKGFPGPAVGQGGQGDTHYYVKNRNNKPNFEAMWYFIPAQSGYYDVYVYVPASPRATQSALYQIFHAGQLSPGILIDQARQPKQWVLLGNYYFTGSQVGQYIYLSNQTEEETATSDILVDAVMTVYVP